MKEQMELFREGGLRDEGGEVEPKSGNKVPSGSLKKEVADDIPVMISEGEFVFPADVVRYIGLETLIKMRQDAKQGLKMMEKMGQMGNPEEAELPDDIPFGMADLIVVSGEMPSSFVLSLNKTLLCFDVSPSFSSVWKIEVFIIPYKTMR